MNELTAERVRWVAIEDRPEGREVTYGPFSSEERAAFFARQHDGALHYGEVTSWILRRLYPATDPLTGCEHRLGRPLALI